MRPFMFTAVPGRMIQFLPGSRTMTLIARWQAAGGITCLDPRHRLMGGLIGAMRAVFVGFMPDNRVVKEGEL